MPKNKNNKSIAKYVRNATVAPRSSRKILIIAAVVLLIAAFGGVFAYNRHSASTTTPNTVEPKPTQSTTNLDPPTDEDKQAVDDQKQAIVDSQEHATPPPPPGSKKDVTPTIVDASQYGDQVEVRSYVSGIIESGGTCTATFTKGSQTVTKTAAGVADATTTRCSIIDVSRSEFASAGSWSIAVTYDSAAAHGSSPAKTFEVQ
jgi:hypothetical protein